MLLVELPKDIRCELLSTCQVPFVDIHKYDHPGTDRYKYAIGKNLLSINTCGENYLDQCFAVLHRARTKYYLNILEPAIIKAQCLALCRLRNLTYKLKLFQYL